MIHDTFERDPHYRPGTLSTMPCECPGTGKHCTLIERSHRMCGHPKRRGPGVPWWKNPTYIVYRFGGGGVEWWRRP